MPLYEYKCTTCHSIFEVLQKVNDKPLKKCIKCGGSLEKVISPPALQFKGTGWYITDYAQKKQPGTRETEAGKPKTKKESASKKDTPSSVGK